VKDHVDRHANSTLTSPMELIKVNQQADLSRHSSKSIFAVIRDVYRRSGVRGFYRGYPATMMRELGYGSYFWGVCVSLRGTAVCDCTIGPGPFLHPDLNLRRIAFFPALMNNSSTKQHAVSSDLPRLALALTGMTACPTRKVHDRLQTLRGWTLFPNLTQRWITAI
jgi:hypothetical protein